MPVHAYGCRSCNHRWGVLIFQGLTVPKPQCPRCQSEDVEDRDVAETPADHGLGCPCCT